jgi:glycosyltransferase involved in cell wall biosynthesis
MSECTNPRISVITVTFNAEKTLRPTIESVLSQTYDNVEHIIVDGMSTDGTLAIIDEYRSRLQTVVREPDRGIYDAMNKGLAVATGEYLGFLNAGDSFHETETLRRIVDSIPGERLPDLLYGETALVDEHRRFVRMKRLSAPEHLHWKSFKMGMVVCHQAFFVRRELVEPYDPRYRLSADFDWCIRMMRKSTVLHNTRLIAIDYLNEGMTTKNLRASRLERLRIMFEHYGVVSTLAHHVWFAVRAVLDPE